MKFRGHLLGGMAAGAIVVGIAAQAGAVSIATSSARSFLNTFLAGEGSALAAGGVFLLTVLMSLFPDLDTASVPQRWFYRFAFAVLLLLFLQQQMDLFAAVTFILLAPVLHRHRGWTHSRLTPFVVAMLMVLLLGYFRMPRLPDRIAIDLAIRLLRDYWIVILACVAGHYTHLVLDAH